MRPFICFEREFIFLPFSNQLGDVAVEVEVEIGGEAVEVAVVNGAASVIEVAAAVETVHVRNVGIEVASVEIGVKIESVKNLLQKRIKKTMIKNKKPRLLKVSCISVVESFLISVIVKWSALLSIVLRISLFLPYL